MASTSVDSSSAYSDSASMPPPSVIPSQSSDRKRKRQPSTSSAVFSAATRHRLYDLYPNHACWHCDAMPPDIAHVITRRDHQFNLYKSAGLLTIDSLSDMQNAVLLCPLCHRNFDDHNNPGFVFFPTDLDYFRQHEERDAQRRRERYLITGTPTVRISPTASDYLNHQRNNGLEDADSVGGIYERYVLRDYFPRILSGSRVGQVARPTSWHGDPMAALRRAFAAISSPITPGIPLQRKKELHSLKQLYEETDACYQATDPPVDRASPSQDGDSHGRQPGGPLAREAPSPGPERAPSQPPAREGGDAATDAAQSTSRHHRTTTLPLEDRIPTPPCSLLRNAEPAFTSAPADSNARAAQTAAIVTPSTATVVAAAGSNEKKRSRHPTVYGNDREEAPRSKRPKVDADPFDNDLSRHSISDGTVISKTPPLPPPPPPHGWRWGPEGTASQAIDFYVDVWSIKTAQGGARQNSARPSRP